MAGFSNHPLILRSAPGLACGLLTSDTAGFKSALQKLPELKYEETFTVKIRGETSRGYLVTFR
jgi:hypothetical protein